MYDSHPLRPTLVARELCRLARLTNVVQRATIHSVVMIAWPGDRPRRVANVWRVHYARCSWEYSNSSLFEEQRWWDQQAWERRLQTRTDEALLRLRQADAQEVHQIVDSLHVLCASPDFGFVTVSWHEVYQALYGLGFRPGDRLGELATMNARSEVRWMAGLVMSAIVNDAATLVGKRHLLAINLRAQEWLRCNPQVIISCPG